MWTIQTDIVFICTRFFSQYTSIIIRKTYSALQTNIIDRRVFGSHDEILSPQCCDNYIFY